MKKNRIIIFVLLIVFLLFIILSKSGLLTSVMNNSRLEKIDNYSISHELSFVDTEKELEQLYLKNNFKKSGYIYNITQLETMTIESANEYLLDNNHSLYPEASYYIFRNDDRARILLSISTSKNGIIRKLEKGSSDTEMTINEYMDGLIQALQNKKDMFTNSRSSLVNKKPDNVYYQRVYDKFTKHYELTFYDCFSYEWFPYINVNNEGLSYFNNLDHPTISEYQAYLYSDTFLIKFKYSSFEEGNKPEIGKMQETIFEVLNNIHIYVPES